MNTGATPPMYGWNRIPWKKIQRNVFKLQKRIYQASRRGDIRTVRALQRLLMHSWSAKLLAVRRITQDNQGKKTAGVDGVKSLTPAQRLTLAQTLTLGDKAAPVRRAWIPKPWSNDLRPLGIPTIHDRALPALAPSVHAPLRYPHHPRPRPPSVGPQCARTRMGSTLCPQQLRLPTGQVLSRCDRSHVHDHRP